jgi:hypothetical protein
MVDSRTNSKERPLDPQERISEVLFALIMVLMFTCSFNVAEAGREEVGFDAARRCGLQPGLGHHRWSILFDGVFQVHGAAAF